MMNFIIMYRRCGQLWQKHEPCTRRTLRRVFPTCMFGVSGGDGVQGADGAMELANALPQRML